MFDMKSVQNNGTCYQVQTRTFQNPAWGCRPRVPTRKTNLRHAHVSSVDFACLYNHVDSLSLPCCLVRCAHLSANVVACYHYHGDGKAKMSSIFEWGKLQKINYLNNRIMELVYTNIWIYWWFLHKATVTPVRKQWNYCSLVLSHCYEVR